MVIALSSGKILIFEARTALWYGKRPREDRHIELLSGPNGDLTAHLGLVSALLFEQTLYRGNGILFSGGADRSIKVWDFPDVDHAISRKGKCIQTLQGHGGTILALAYASAVLVSCASGGSLVIWRPDPTRAVLRYPAFVAHQYFNLEGLSSPFPWRRAEERETWYTCTSPREGTEGLELLAGSSEGVVTVFKLMYTPIAGQTQLQVQTHETSHNNSTGQQQPQQQRQPSLEGVGRSLEAAAFMASAHAHAQNSPLAPVAVKGAAARSLNLSHQGWKQTAFHRDARLQVLQRGALQVLALPVESLAALLGFDRRLYIVDVDESRRAPAGGNPTDAAQGASAVAGPGNSGGAGGREQMPSAAAPSSAVSGGAAGGGTNAEGAAVPPCFLVPASVKSVEANPLDRSPKIVEVFAHSGLCAGLFFRPSLEGGRLYSAATDNFIRSWDLTTHTCLTQLKEKSSEITCLRYLPGTRLLLSGHENGELRLWNLDERSTVTLKGNNGSTEIHQNSVSCMCVCVSNHPAPEDPSTKAKAQKVSLFSSRSGSSVDSEESDEPAVRRPSRISTALPPEGPLRRGSLSLRHASAASALSMPDGDAQAVKDAGLSTYTKAPSGKTVQAKGEKKGAASAAELMEQLEDLQKEKEDFERALEEEAGSWGATRAARRTLGLPMEVPFDLVATGGYDCRISVWRLINEGETTTAKMEQSFLAHPTDDDEIMALKYLPSHQILISGSLDQTVKVWNVTEIANIAAPLLEVAKQQAQESVGSGKKKEKVNEQTQKEKEREAELLNESIKKATRRQSLGPAGFANFLNPLGAQQGSPTSPQPSQRTAGRSGGAGGGASGFGGADGGAKGPDGRPMLAVGVGSKGVFAYPVQHAHVPFTRMAPVAETGAAKGVPMALLALPPPYEFALACAHGNGVLSFMDIRDGKEITRQRPVLTKDRETPPEFLHLCLAGPYRSLWIGCDDGALVAFPVPVKKLKEHEMLRLKEMRQQFIDLLRAAERREAGEGSVGSAELSGDGPGGESPDRDATQGGAGSVVEQSLIETTEDGSQEHTSRDNPKGPPMSARPSNGMSENEKESPRDQQIKKKQTGIRRSSSRKGQGTTQAPSQGFPTRAGSKTQNAALN
uniref:Uncharacterized protein n=1 Tax=Chromera velia CCMP2878 TaxID=1169474 RepID=A0A0G4FU49_9ALVE|eukprot:Cvel_18687.t1-p1 / transcript=Cvel_18687.t1 / gene=Cvel_18687 / organism=Chromera_velia_CCMP2878 / gene_product=hypothetical protein / transcript_product=hypothetical protein / location=Cvel_scaffold1564:8331-17586(+) / protein_length=1122 / sequence_SO=supercontig / SO=protein_coding / is_pseudo=false